MACRETMTVYAVSILYCSLHMLVAEARFEWPAMSATVVRRVRTCVENIVRGLGREGVYVRQKKNFGRATIAAVHLGCGVPAWRVSSNGLYLHLS